MKTEQEKAEDRVNFKRSVRKIRNRIYELEALILNLNRLKELSGYQYNKKEISYLEQNIKVMKICIETIVEEYKKEESYHGH